MIDEQRIRRARRLCLFAHYHQDGIVAPHVLYYLRALRDAGFTVLVLSTAALDEAECDALRAAGAEVLLRENRGMDFGGWIEACRRFFPVDAELLLLANDSVYGPLGDLSAFVDALLRHDADFYGAVESPEIVPHLQSWFVLLRPRAFRSEAFTNLMCAPMPEFSDKLALVTSYEVALTRRLMAAGLRYHAAFSPARAGGIAGRYAYNPAHILWREMIAAGVPFLKIELLRINLMRVTDTGDWPAVVGAYAPDLMPMIKADLSRRGVKARPGFGSMSPFPAIYRPELRGIVLLDHRSARRGGAMGLLRLTIFRAAMLLGELPRQLHARSLLRRAGRVAPGSGEG